MTRHRRPRGASIIALPILAAVLVGCAESPKSRFYTLSALDQPGAIDPVAKAPFQVDAVSLPTSLERPQIIRAVNDNVIQVNEYERWAGPLREMFSRVLIEDLASRMGLSPALLIWNAPSASDRILSVRVSDFSADLDGQVALEASWTLSNGQGQTILSSQLRITRRAPSPETKDVVRAMDATIAELAGRIVDDVHRRGIT